MATSIKLSDHLKNRLQQLAKQRQRSMHWIMCQAIQDYINREEAQENFKQEAIASWQAFQTTGKHLQAQEIENWLNTWGSPSETKIPPCHD